MTQWQNGKMTIWQNGKMGRFKMGGLIEIQRFWPVSQIFEIQSLLKFWSVSQVSKIL